MLDLKGSRFPFLHVILLNDQPTSTLGLENGYENVHKPTFVGTTLILQYSSEELH